jgi:hypothetical protein
MPGVSSRPLLCDGCDDVFLCHNANIGKGEKGRMMKTEIKSAIDRSVSRNEIVHITIDGDSGDALEAIHEVFDGDTDYAMSADTMDVWGWTDETAKNDQDWRLAIQFTDS